RPPQRPHTYHRRHALEEGKHEHPRRAVGAPAASHRVAKFSESSLTIKFCHSECSEVTASLIYGTTTSELPPAVGSKINQRGAPHDRPHLARYRPRIRQGHLLRLPPEDRTEGVRRDSRQPRCPHPAPYRRRQMRILAAHLLGFMGRSQSLRRTQPREVSLLSGRRKIPDRAWSEGRALRSARTLSVHSKDRRGGFRV